MLKTVALTGLLAFSCAANAAITWNFTYTGFLEENTGLFTDYQLKGSFSGEDFNSDGFLDQGEITSLFLNGTDYIGCAGDTNAFYYCGTESFRYEVGGKLDFSAGVRASDPEGYYSGGHHFIAGVSEYDYRFMGQAYTQSAYLWTDQTQFTISAGPISGAPVSTIPEPGTWAMLSAGLLLVAGSSLRRRKHALLKTTAELDRA